MSESRARRSRVKLYAALLVVPIVCAGIAGAAYFTMKRVVSPEAVSSRLETMVGYPVEIGDVGLNPVGMEAKVSGLKLGPSVEYKAVSLRLDPWAALSGNWRLRKAELNGGVWVVPSSRDHWESFVKGALSPMWLAKHADVVLMKSGEVRGSDGEEILASRIQGEFSTCGPSDEIGRRCYEARVEGHTDGEDKFSLKSTYTISDPGDSLDLNTLSLSLPGLELAGRALATLKPRPEMTLELTSEDYFGGDLELSAGLGRTAAGPSLMGRATLSGADAAALLTEWSGLTLLHAGTMNAAIDLAGSEPEWWKGGVAGIIKGGSAVIEGAVLDASDPAAAFVPMTGSSGQANVERASARFQISGADVLIEDYSVTLDKAVWRGSGKIAGDGSMGGVIIGRVPVSALRGGGSALTMVAGLLADGDGKVPVAFRVSGTLERPVLGFDLDAVVQEAADAGRPQAKSLLKAMSKADRERLRRTVDDLLRGLTVP